MQEQTIPVPASPDNSVGGNFNTYDVSFFDPVTELDYVADRSNAAVDIFSGATETFVGRVGGSGQFVGQQARNADSGPDGVVVARQGNPRPIFLPATATARSRPSISTTIMHRSHPRRRASTAAPNTGGMHRVDEMAFDPKDNIVAAANNADTPPFVTLVNAANPGTIIAKTTFDGTNKAVPIVAGNGIEQPVWDKNTQRFYISVPQIGASASDPGCIAALDATGTVTGVFDLANFGISSCSSSGLSVANNLNGHGTVLGINCGNAGTQVVLFDPTANGGSGAIVGKFTQFCGGDEDWFDPTTGLFFFAEQTNARGPVLGIINGNTDTFSQTVATTPGDHSVAVDPVTGDAFVPAGGIAGNTVCPTGCVLVFENAVVAAPEPASLTLTMTALAGLAGLVAAPTPVLDRACIQCRG